MLIIYCGENSISSYQAYFELKKNYQNKNYQILNINFDDLENIHCWLGENQSLFAEKKVFFSQNLLKKFNNKNPKIKKIIDQLIRERQVEIVDWEEETTAKNLTISKNKNVIIKEFKLKENIFKLAESLYPGNLKSFIYLLNQLSDNISEYLIFTIIIKQIRNLILIKLNQLDKKLASWQIYKLKFQSKKWSLDKLINFYQSLYNLEIKEKTSNNPLGIIKSLQIITSYYLNLL